VLILVPDSLVHQWFVELLRRFNLWFHIFDEERCVALEEGAPDGNPFLDDQLIVCSTSFLAGDPKRALQALSAGWDMLVVDEAHHLEWSVEEASRDYQVVELLSKQAEGLLLLTATPEQLGLESHFARLRLLDQDRYSDFHSFQNETKGQQKTADIVEKLSQGTELAASEEKYLISLTGKTDLVPKGKGGENVRNQLIQELLDQHGPGRVIFRNRRISMSGFPARKALLAPLEPSAKSGESMDADSVYRPKNDPRLPWLIDLMEELQPAKVLLICKHKETVLALEQAIKSRVKLKVGVFHEDLTLVQRDRNAAWFSEAKGARLLLCSEIGSEGRNFQYAHHLILFDLPNHPELLEQRIGRLDRIGQKKDIQIHVPYLQGSAQEVLVRWYHEGLNAFEQNLEGGDKIARKFAAPLQELVATADTGKRLNALIKEAKSFQKQLTDTLAKGRDRLLEMNSFRPKIAQKLISQIKSEDQSPALETYMMEVFEQFNIEIEDIAPRTYLVHAPKGNALAFPGIPDEGIGITFDRKRALSREEISFLTWDHPMVTGAIDLIEGSGTGSASFGRLVGTGSQGILIEAIFVLETAGSQGNEVDRFLPQTPLRVVVDHTCAEVTGDFPIDEMALQLRPGDIDPLLDNEMLVETLIPKMLEAATSIAEQKAKVEIANGLQRMRATLDHEIDRLRTLQAKNNHIRPEEIRIAVEARAKLVSLIEEARVRLDGVMLVQKG
jgi:ATP-dependent helicase HepA